jgi:hypothetical protein
MRKKRSTITVKMVREWINLYENKKITIAEIAEMYGCSSCVVRSYLRNNGVVTTRFREHRKQKSHKNCFLIALYDLEEQLVGVFDNVYELSDYCGKTVGNVRCMLCPKNINAKMRINGKWYRKELIEVI